MVATSVLKIANTLLGLPGAPAHPSAKVSPPALAPSSPNPLATAPHAPDLSLKKRLAVSLFATVLNSPPVKLAQFPSPANGTTTSATNTPLLTPTAALNICPNPLALPTPTASGSLMLALPSRKHPLSAASLLLSVPHNAPALMLHSSILSLDKPGLLIKSSIPSHLSLSAPPP